MGACNYCKRKKILWKSVHCIPVQAFPHFENELFILVILIPVHLLQQMLKIYHGEVLDINLSNTTRVLLEDGSPNPIIGRELLQGSPPQGLFIVATVGLPGSCLQRVSAEARRRIVEALTPAVRHWIWRPPAATRHHRHWHFVRDLASLVGSHGFGIGQILQPLF